MAFIKHEPKKLTALVVYGTTSGNAELVAEAICDGLCESEIQSKVSKSEITDAAEATNYDLCVLVCSTWDVGKLNPNFIKFHEELKKQDVKGKKFEVVGLGDSENYDIFCGAADILEETIKSLGGIQHMETLRIDTAPHSKLLEYKKWGSELAEILKSENI